MQTPSNLSTWERINNWLNRSISLKLFTIGFLVILLLIPSSMIENLIRERQITRDASINEVSSKWGEQQIVGGPVLTIPFKVETTDEKGRIQTFVKYAHFLPETLHIQGNLQPEKRYRGIYVVMLYRSQLRINGQFSFPDFEKLKISPQSIIWKDAFVSLGITDPKGIRQAIQLKFNNQAIEFDPGQATKDLFSSGVGAPVSISPEVKAPFTFDLGLQLNGSSDLQFLPFGKETHVHLTSPWSTPSFIGTFLPEKREITAKGFSVDWKVLQYNRNYPQQGIDSFITATPSTREIQISEAPPAYVGANPSQTNGVFGVKLLLPIDEYQKTTRSAKYSMIFVTLTFASFFFVEILGRRRIHPIQYLLVGFAICLFYILLLSISEHISFNWAYLLSTATILSLILMYTRSVFKDLRYTLIFNGILALLYGFFYSLLQLEDYALLLGSLGLLLILACIMYLTRKLDWYHVYDQE